MIILYLRSSSYNAWDYCQQSYFIQYVLGHQQLTNIKAEKGTVVHKVMEVLANMTLAVQNNPNCIQINDEHIGSFFFTKESLLEPTELSSEQIREINASRINKQTYVTPGFLSDGHIRYGVGIVGDIFKRAYDYYSSQEKSPNIWKPADRRDCENFVWMVLDYKGGLYDPRRKNIFDVEHRFEIEIKEPWAQYSYIMSDGSEISGNLAIKGTVDLVLNVDGDTLEVVDWKTGQRFDWGKKRVKGYAELQQDPQLMLYYYALSKMYPNIKHIMLTIFFVRDGGPFTLCFDEQDLKKTELMIERRFREIRNSEQPILIDPSHKDFKCSKLCPFLKKKLKPEHNLGMCDQIHQDIKLYGIDYTIHEYTEPGFSIAKYLAPGT